MTDHYAALNLSRDASPDEIKRAYRRESARCHPDREGGSVEAQQRVNEAYAVLSDPERRARYDAGEAEAPAGPSNVELLVIQEFLNVLHGSSPAADLIGATRAKLQHRLEVLQDRLWDVQQERKRLALRATTLKYKGSGESLLHNVMTSHLASIDALLAQSEEEIETLRAALKLLDNWEDEGREKPPAASIWSDGHYRGRHGAYFSKF